MPSKRTRFDAKLDFFRVFLPRMNSEELNEVIKMSDNISRNLTVIELLIT